MTANKRTKYCLNVQRQNSRVKGGEGEKKLNRKIKGKQKDDLYFFKKENKRKGNGKEAEGAIRAIIMQK
jgi:hypothetical protein